MHKNGDKAVAYWFGIAVGVLMVLFVLATDRARAADDPKDEKIKLLQAELDKAKKEAEELRKRNEALTTLLEQARKQALTAEAAAKAAQLRAEENLKKSEDVFRKLQELKKDENPRRPLPLVPNLRGKVTDVTGDQVTLDIGIDAGLEVGTTIDIYRLEGGPRYLGTVKVVDAKKLKPKTAIVTFTPARKVAFDKLRPEELPKKSDEVRPLIAATGNK